MSRRFIWQDSEWPHWRWDNSELLEPLSRVHKSHGILLGRLADIGLAQRRQVALEALVDDVVGTSAIEGELLPTDSVRSSLARRLGIETAGFTPVSRVADGIVDLILDATENRQMPLTAPRLFGWHAALFPTGYSGIRPLRVGAWRDDFEGAMLVVSGAFGRQTVHFEAPPAEVLPREMDVFLEWANQQTDDPCLLRAGIAHLWFVTIHPFDDGNGRVARAITDLFLSRCDPDPMRFYSMSAQIERDRTAYYEHLEHAQCGSMDATNWLKWFLETLEKAVARAHRTVDDTLRKQRFWFRFRDVPFNSRQIQMVNRLLDGFDGKLTSRKWALIAKCSTDTALRDIGQLVEIGALRKTEASGRATSYELQT